MLFPEKKIIFTRNQQSQPLMNDECEDTLGENMNLQKKTVKELQDELRSRGLPTSGKKAELVARLEENSTSSVIEATIVENVEKKLHVFLILKYLFSLIHQRKS